MKFVKATVVYEAISGSANDGTFIIWDNTHEQRIEMRWACLHDLICLLKQLDRFSPEQLEEHCRDVIDESAE